MAVLSPTSASSAGGRGGPAGGQNPGDRQSPEPSTATWTRPWNQGLLCGMRAEAGTERGTITRACAEESYAAALKR